MIYVRTALLRSAAGAVVLWVGTVLAALFLVAAALRAQEAPTPVKTPEGAKVEAAVPAKPTGLGLVLPEQAKVRCFASDLSPNFEDTLQKGAVVALGRTEGGYTQVMLPFGPVGYVNKKFTSAAEAGVVKTVGKGVSFRYRTKAGEAPVALLPDGQELRIIGEQDDWWRVRLASCECWLPQAEVQAFADPPETMQRTHAELQKVQQGEIDAWLAKVAAADEKVKLQQEEQKKLVALNEEFRKVGTLAMAEQDYSGVEQQLSAFEQELAADAPAREGVKALRKRIVDRKWVVEAAAVRSSVPPPAKDLPVVQADVPDAMGRFDAIGWLRRHSPLGRPAYFTVEKGGQVLYHITCSAQRYDLALFVDKEVGLIGPKRRPSADSLRMLDVAKIEVLGIAGG